MISMFDWWIVNLDTGETRRVRALDSHSACAAAGWHAQHCDARVLPPRELDERAAAE